MERNWTLRILPTSSSTTAVYRDSSFSAIALGTTRRVGRFLPLVNNDSELEPPRQPSRWSPGRDARIDWGVLTLIEEDAPSAWHLFAGERLLPFAALYRGSRHPDTLNLTEGEVNLLAFMYHEPEVPPRVVVWLADEAQKEYERWSSAIIAVNPCETDEPVNYSAFTVPVAARFDEFVHGLKQSPE